MEARPSEWVGDEHIADVQPHSQEYCAISSLLSRGLPNLRINRIERVQKPEQWEKYIDRVKVMNKYHDGANETLLLHGTGEHPPHDVLKHGDGLDPRFSTGKGFYGRGTYLAESPAYPIAGRYVHHTKGKLQLVVVRAALGVSQNLGFRVDDDTREMTMPGQQPNNRDRHYDSVRAGPHRPYLSGPGSGSIGGDDPDSSIIHVVYQNNQMYPAYIVTFDMGGGDLGDGRSHKLGERVTYLNAEKQPVRQAIVTHADVSAGCYTIEYEKNTTAARLHYPPDDDDDRGVVGRGGVVPRLGRALRKGDDVFYEESKSGARLPAVIIMVESPTTNDEGGRPAYVVAVRQTTGAIRLLGTS
ncbi:hypothetical protein EMIHUDRAFT_226969 [Emiliania huxleyi CCMP1516]|uniref:Poly [ADP-ribose] polymerase n=2 Tax=Emiliania huxleyi TaxID=2903 RepID=A0A0D3KK03_EMIH1|nr:hypothetical protein EMIHUDRAFT_226969 [Emiliania huxleyi CCMP1516]EOD36088.1 hypothetical protein EMIHUDRAFT_226969 [Emiliania huxleyi CCMP1516]|eukprot:XP_005788517.1 hypothetical protein EMIHUDRAFT_226969 [Emiliania huxleyi CCMP1516]